MSTDKNQSKICIVVPAKGTVEKITECIESILATQYPCIEIILVDDGLDNVTHAKLEQLKDRISILKSDGRGPSYARNLAAKQTNAELIAFTDSDCLVKRDWLTELVRGFERFPDIVACGGRQELPFDATNFEKRVFLFMKKANLISDYLRTTKDKEFLEVEHLPSYNVMYRREVFLKEGGFLEGLWPGEDLELDYRLRKKGYNLVWNPSAVVYHYKPQNLRSFAKMMYRYGWAQGFLVGRYGAFRRLHILPFIFGFIIVLLVLSFFFKSLSPVLMFAAAALFFLSIIYFRFDFIVFFLFILAIFGWHLGFFRGLSSSRVRS